MADWEEDDDDDSAGTGVATETRSKVKKPSLYKVLLHNDDYTPMDFVVLVLQSVFHKEESEAVAIMYAVHKQGIGVAGVYTYEIAESKVEKVAKLAKEHDYPFMCTIE